MAAISTTVKDRFWSKVSRGADADCWEWTAAKSPAGYGSFKFEGIAQTASRVAWILTYGAVTSRHLHVCHHCDNPGCCNPRHLYLAPRSINTADAYARGLFPQIDRAGQSNGRAQITEADAVEILARIQAGETNAQIAADYPVSSSLISAIRTGKAWAHLPRATAA